MSPSNTGPTNPGGGPPGPAYPNVPLGTRRRVLGSDPVAQIPTVATVGANAIAATAATLIGSVNPNGILTTWWFAYGTSQQLGTTTATASAGSGTVPVTVTFGLTGLTVGTTYYYAAVGQSSAGTVYGAILSFTAVAPQQPATPAVSLIGTPSVNIPHFNVPFTMVTKDDVAQGIEVVEQDSFEEVLADVNTIVECPIGACPLLPTFGIPSQEFAQMPPNKQAIISAIQFWEPRANETAIAQLLPDGSSWGITLTTAPTGDALN